MHKNQQQPKQNQKQQAQQAESKTYADPKKLNGPNQPST
ncbi:hypothetical protein JOC83_002164 [Bacillus iocasae]|uniref:Uncharacterized protein n=1 Tax=Priestia iocasae TaxID=2291674 RepID=A0ABS2QWI9_9BACI|nr:hypothetical protein [Metabacillus iocasae]